MKGQMMAARTDQKTMEETIKSSLSYRVQQPGSIGAMLDFEFVECSAEDGTAVLSHRIDEREINIYGTLHGGIITWLMDSTMGILGRAYSGYETIVTMDIHVNFLRAVYENDLALIRGRVTHAGSKVLNLVSELYVGDRLCATADAIFYRIEK